MIIWMIEDKWMRDGSNSKYRLRWERGIYYIDAYKNPEWKTIADSSHFSKEVLFRLCRADNSETLSALTAEGT